MLETELLEEKLKKEDLFEAYEIAGSILEKSYDLDVAYKMGVICSRIGKISEAQERLTQYLDEGGNEPFARLNLAHMLKAQRDFSGAAKEYKRFIIDNPSMAGSGWWHLADLKDFSPEQTEIELLEGSRSALADSHPDRMLMNFALGTYFERLGEAAKAFDAFWEANNAHCRIKPFHREAFRKLIADLDKLQKIPHFDFETSAVPIFIVGMPRSGSTLCEQILSSHSRVIATDELPFINAFAAGMERTGSYANAIHTLTEASAYNLREQYFEKTAHYRIDKNLHFIDKSPINFIHIGLIKTILPEAIIINTYRDAFDNAMSLYKRYFYMGNEYAYSLENIAEYMNGYLRLMNIWDRLLPGQIIHCQYEALINGPDRKIREIVEDCGLPFEENCLNFFQNKRAVLTPSVDQVTKPIYKNAVDSWKMYAAHFSEVDKFRFALINKGHETWFGSGKYSDDVATWSEYWASGFKTSFRNAVSYEGEIKTYWQGLIRGQESSGRVLDICTGNGALALLLAEEAKEKDIDITGVDSAMISPEVTSEAAASVGIRFVGNTSIEKLPFENQYFDLVVSQFGIEYSNLESAVPEVSRVLKVGGKFNAICHFSGSAIHADNKAIYECTEKILQNCAYYFGEMLKNFDLEKLGDSSYKPIAEYSRGRFNEEIGKLNEQYGEILFATGFPDSMKFLLAHKQSGNAYARFCNYLKSLRSAQERLEQLFKATFSPEDLEDFLDQLKKAGLEIHRIEDFKQNNFVIGKLIETVKL